MSALLLPRLLNRVKCAVTAFKTCDGTTCSHHNVAPGVNTLKNRWHHHTKFFGTPTDAPVTTVPETEASPIEEKVMAPPLPEEHVPPSEVAEKEKQAPPAAPSPAYVRKLQESAQPLTYSPPSNTAPIYTFTTRAEMDLEEFGLSTEDVTELLKNSIRTPHYSLDNVTVCLSEEYYIQVTKDDVVISVQTRMAVEEDYVAPVYKAPAQPKLPGQKTKRAERSAPNNTRQFKRILISEFGFAVDISGGTHMKVTHEDYPGKSVFFANTPSDNHWYQNACRDIKKEFGVDVRIRKTT